MIKSVPKIRNYDNIALPQTDSPHHRRAVGAGVHMAAHSNSSCEECRSETVWRHGGGGITPHGWFFGANEYAHRTANKMALVFLVDLSRKRCTDDHHCLAMLLRRWMPSMVCPCSMGCT